MDERFEELIEKLKQYMPGLPEKKIREVYAYAMKAHEGQKRKTGEPYIIHPLEVAHNVAEMGLDADSVMAALLHDSIEDTEVNYDEIRDKFGAAVADIVDGVTKLSRVAYTSKEEQQMENLRKMFLAMARDIRVILVKIADRLHNMRTIDYQDEEKQREKALETMEIYAPLAHRLGMQKIKWELEDRALQCLDPVGYNEIAEALRERSEQHNEFLNRVKARIEQRLGEGGISCQIDGRVKHIYSIYRKMYNQHKAINEIYDLYAFRVIVDTVTDCYNVMGFIHDLYKPVPGRFKDYISTPKPNMYQSLHTTVIGREGVPFEVQIRTWDMHHTAEYGIAAHWKYKQGLQGDLGMEEKLEWVRRLLEAQQDTDAEDFIRNLKIDMFADEVFVFTPKGDVVNLPAGATPIDFAYAIHSAVGNRMTGAKVAGRIVGFEYQLQNGDIVEIITTGASHGPSRDWMKIAKTNEARNKIKQWFKKERREENIARGKEDFERELRRGGLSPADITQEDVLPAMLKKMSFSNLDELYAGIGYGGITATKAINRMRDELIRINRLQNEKTTVEKLMSAPPKKPSKAGTGVIVQGLENCLVKFARCCTPVPGDDIVGFITRGYGVSVHRADCVNALPAHQDNEEGRWVQVSWAHDLKDTYQTSVQVSAKDRDGLVLDVATTLSAMKVTMKSLSARDLGDGYAVADIILEARDKQQLTEILNKLTRIKGVITVERKAAS